jgi:hypothetical protein
MSEAQETLELSEAQIAVHWREEEYIYPPAPFIAQANMTDPQIYERFSLEHFPEYFKDYADLLSWYQYWHTTLDTSDAPCWKWFVGGRINAAYNCVDRHLARYKNKAAIVYVPEPEDEPHMALTYMVRLVQMVPWPEFVPDHEATDLRALACTGLTALAEVDAGIHAGILRLGGCFGQRVEAAGDRLGRQLRQRRRQWDGRRGDGTAEGAGVGAEELA